MAARHGKLLQSLNVTERELCAVSKRLRFLRGDVTAKRPERSEKRTEPVAWWHLGRDARQNLGHLDPAPLFRRLTRRDSHGEGDNAVLASDGRIGLRAGLDGVDEGKSLGLVSGDIPANTGQDRGGPRVCRLIHGLLRKQGTGFRGTGSTGS